MPDVPETAVVPARHVHQAFDAVADLRRHHLHALRQLAGEHLGLVLRRHLQRAQVARVRVERHGGQGDDREEEEGDDQAKSEGHGQRGSASHQ